VLDELAEVLRAAGDPVIEVLAPPLQPTKVRAQLDAVGIASPPDVVAWFGWHNGTTDRQFLHQLGGAPVELLSLDDAIERHAMIVGIEGAFDMQELPRPWPRQALPFIALSGGGSLGIQPGGGGALAGRLIRHWSDSGVSAVEPFEDLTALASRWLELHRTGHYRWDGARWDSDYFALPVEHRIGVL